MFKSKKSIGLGQIFTLLVLLGLLQPGKLNRRRFVGMSALALAGLGSLGGVAGSLLGGTPASARPRTGQNPIQLENALPGNPFYDDGSGRTTWSLSLISDDPDYNPNNTAPIYQIKGYASATSVNKGDSLDLHVRIYNNKPYYMELFRVGWYNGDGARQIGSKIGPLPGQAHAIPAADSFGMVACNWPVAYTLQTDSSWVSGHYLIRLTIADTATAGQYQNYIHFVLRDDAYQSELLFKSSVTTYQAYNYFGGQSLYQYNSDPELGAAVKVSLDRPYSAEGCGDFFYWEIALVRFLEAQGYDLAYATSLDLHTNPLLPFGHKGVISDGHDEYWSREMFDNAIAARDWGINHAFFGANPCYWQIRMEASASGMPNRVIVGYKDSAIPDPNDPTTPYDPYYDTNPQLTTCRWREDPVNRPENQLLGVMYDNYFDWDMGYPYVVQNTSHWVYTNSGFQDGDAVPGLVGYEWDKEFSNGATPADLTLLSASPVTGYNTDGTQANVATTSHSSIYQAASGAWVFASGTVYWSYGLDCSIYQSKDLTSAGIKQMTRNILDRFISDFRLNPSVSFDWDDGTGTRPGTLSYALKNTTSGQQISFYLKHGDGDSDDGTNTIQPSQPLPPVPAGVTLDGGSCTGGNPAVIIDGSKEPAGTHSTGLALSGGDTLRHIKVTNFGGPQITNSAGGNKFECVVVSKSSPTSPSAISTAPRFVYRPVGRREGSSRRDSRPRKK